MRKAAVLELKGLKFSGEAVPSRPTEFLDLFYLYKQLLRNALLEAENWNL